MLTFPNIDPVALAIGPIPYLGTLLIRWYSLAYVGGILLGWQVLAREHKRKPLQNLTKTALDDMVFWAVLGIVLGGRLGYVLFYKPMFYLEHPAQILHVWEGGMSFHGGMLGTIVAFLLFCRKHGTPFLPVIDLIACMAPIGLCFGRIANFINGELYGRVTDAPIGMVFPHGGALPRHPSQLYEATLEGVVLFIIMMALLKCTRARDKAGMLSGFFLIFYGLARITCEFFREPDEQLGFLLGFSTMGQLLCLPMLAGGLYLVFRKERTQS